MQAWSNQCLCRFTGDGGRGKAIEAAKLPRPITHDSILQRHSDTATQRVRCESGPGENGMRLGAASAPTSRAPPPPPRRADRPDGPDATRARPVFVDLAPESVPADRKVGVAAELTESMLEVRRARCTGSSPTPPTGPLDLNPSFYLQSRGFPDTIEAWGHRGGHDETSHGEMFGSSDDRGPRARVEHHGGSADGRAGGRGSGESGSEQRAQLG